MVKIPLETGVPGRPTMAQLERLLAAAVALQRGGALRGSVVLEMGRQMGLGELTLPCEPSSALDVVLGFALCGRQAKHDLWPSEQDLLKVKGPEVLDEEAFVALVPISRKKLEDPSGFPRAEKFMRWLFNVFRTFLDRDEVPLRQVLGVLCLGKSGPLGLEAACRVLLQDPAQDLVVRDLHTLLMQEGIRDVYASLEPEEVVNVLRDSITPPPEDRATKALPPEERPPITDTDLVRGVIAGGLTAVLAHPGLRALQPFVSRFQRPVLVD